MRFLVADEAAKEMIESTNLETTARKTDGQNQKTSSRRTNSKKPGSGQRLASRP